MTVLERTKVKNDGEALRVHSNSREKNWRMLTEIRRLRVARKVISGGEEDNTSNGMNCEEEDDFGEN